MPEEPTETTTSSFAAMGGSTLDQQMAPATPGTDGAEALEPLSGPQDFGLAGLPMDQQLSRLDEIMEQAQIAADAERDLEAEGADAQLLEEIESDDEDVADGEREPGESEGGDLARTRAELEALKASHQRVLAHLTQQSGYVREANGQFRYENLKAKVLHGTATPEEADEVHQMTEWHMFAGPIYAAAEREISSAFSTGFRRSIESTIKSEKLDSTAAERLWRAPDPIREAVLLGRELERKSSAKATPKPATRPVSPPARRQSTQAPAAPRVSATYRSPNEPGWMAGIMADLDKTMESAATAANARARREEAELEAQSRRRRVAR